jgi:hypothetical protein
MIKTLDPGDPEAGTQTSTQYYPVHFVRMSRGVQDYPVHTPPPEVVEDDMKPR